MNNNTILAIVFLMAGTLLTTTVVTIVPAAYAGGDDHDDDNGDGNKNKAEDESAASIADCDDNDVDRSDFECFGIAVNDIDADLGSMVTATETPIGDMAGAATSATTVGTDIMTNPLFNAP
jgi:hypothetical protein